MSSLLKKMLVAGGIGAGALFGAQALLRRSRWFSFAGKVVLVTGGSRGLGLVLARELVARGAKVAICARTEEDLQTAEEDLRQRGGDVLAVPCDIRSQEQVEGMVEQVVRHFGTVDVLINNAGIIQVGPLESMTLGDFEEAMATHYWGPLYTMLAVLPHMQRRGWGRIVNISSIGGKQPVPHLIPYVGSKFALVGLSTALRTELAEQGILVTTISPGLMRTGSPPNAYFKGQHRKEYAWFSISDSIPVVAMHAQRAARKILCACQNGDADVTIGASARLGTTLQALAPNLMTDLLTVVNHFLPGMGGIGRDRARGHESESAASPSLLTATTERAALQNNERPAEV